MIITKSNTYAGKIYSTHKTARSAEKHEHVHDENCNHNHGKENKTTSGNQNPLKRYWAPILGVIVLGGGLLVAFWNKLFPDKTTATMKPKDKS